MKEIILPYKDLTAEIQEFKTTLNDEFFLGFSSEELLGGAVDLTLKACKFGQGARVEVIFSGFVSVECDRCLEACSIHVESNSCLSVREGEGDEGEDCIWISPLEGELDLTQYIYESVMLALPYQRVHGEDETGKLLCNEQMLERFSIVSESEFEQIAQTKSDKDPEWAKLEELKEKLNQ